MGPETSFVYTGTFDFDRFDDEVVQSVGPHPHPIDDIDVGTTHATHAIRGIENDRSPTLGRPHAHAVSSIAELQPGATPPLSANPNYPLHPVSGSYLMASSTVAGLEHPHLGDLGRQYPGNVDATDSSLKTSNSPVSGSTPLHRRGYQACDPCRKRKVKCDLGDVDKPQLGKCARCLREKKDCVFSPTRRKRKPSQDTSGSEREFKRIHTGGESSYDETYNSQPDSAGYPYPQSPAQKILSGSPHLPWSNAQMSQIKQSPQEQSLQKWQGGSSAPPKSAPNMNNYPQSAPSTAGPKVKDESLVLNLKAAKMLKRPVAIGHDLLHLLTEAAEKSDKAASKSGATGESPLSGASKMAPQHDRSPKDPNHLEIRDGVPIKQAFRAHMTQWSTSNGEHEPSDEAKVALRAWSSMRFVRAGWFTAEEAMYYIDYYYENLAPLTPVVLPDYRPPAAHLTLLTEEPILAIAILSIASRYAKLSGPAHASRPIDIQTVLWTYLRSLVERLLWGQEQFGGGFCGGGAVNLREAKTGQITWKGSLRTLGTVEALLLLTEWQPRALHFPPGDDENKLVYGGLASVEEEEGDVETAHAPAFSHWLEPQWRSDRMSWMLLGLAQSLAFELGVFDKDTELCSEVNEASEIGRKVRLRRLVLLYVSQTSGRLGITSPLSLSDFAREWVLDSKNDTAVDVMQKLWLDIASIMNKANEEIFPSREVTRNLTSSGQYAAKVDEFWPLLENWKKKYDGSRNQLDKTMQFILLMDYDYARLYINSLGLQAMVGQLTRIKSKQSHAVPPATLLAMYQPNQKYIREVYLAGRQILLSTLQGLVPESHLTHASVRTYSRILSGLIFSLKCLTFGATEPQYLEMLHFVDEATTNLRDMIVDDVHLASHSADLIARLTKHLRSKFARFTLNPGGSESASRDRTPAPLHSQQQTLSHQRTNGNVPLEPVPEGLPVQTYGYHFDGSTFQPSDGLNDMLGQIPTQPMAELENMTDSFMPPPDYNTYIGMDVPGSSDTAGATTLIAEDNTVPDWLAVPLNNFFNNSSMPVDQGFGGIGPTVGDKDMLELATNSQYTRWGEGPMSFQSGY